LDENDTWYCPRCKEHRRAFKKLDLWSLPKFLIIHLKRFQYTRYSREKIDTEIQIPTKVIHVSNNNL
jgi:ubiquitin C-terminal hydrolase